MARVLCAWEFGGDLGHVRRVIPIAHELRAMGHEVTLAFRDSSFIENGRAQGFETFIAPLLNTQREMSPSPLNFSDILLNIGYGDVRGVAGALRAWQSMLEMLAPDVVVADYAPTALIAATLASIRTVTVGTGFSVPAAGDPIPDLRPWSPTDPNILRALDDRILGIVRRAVGTRATRLPARAHELFKGRVDLLCTFREIDPFGPRDGVEYVGPQGDATSGIEVRWTGDKSTCVFAYLKPRSARFEATLAGLASLDAEVIVAAPGLEAGRAKSASTASMRVFASAVNLALVLKEASLCVSHAGPGVAARAMAAGVPMALMPLQLEQFLIAKRIEKTGAALVSNPEEPAPDYAKWLSEFLSRETAREASRRLRERYHDHDFVHATARAARRIAEVATA
jgi:UDP:flavonoid glycosyltransferase YjiC (YdhE family)